MQNSPIMKTVLMLAVSLVITGCAGYRLGSSLPAHLKTVFVPAFLNQTAEPMLETTATAHTLEALQNDGSLAISNQDGADTLLKVTLLELTLEPVRYETGSRKTAEEYRMQIHAQYEFVEQRTGETLLKGKVFGETTFEPGDDIATAKRAATPEASRNLARQIVKSVVTFW